MTKFFSIL